MQKEKSDLSLNTELNTKAEVFLKKGFKLYYGNNIKEALNMFSEANKIFTSMHDMANISVCLSWISLLNYLINSSNYYKIIIMLNDAKFLAETSESEYAEFNYYFVSGSINYLDGNYTEALYHLEKAKNLANENNELNARIYILLANIFEINEQYEKAYQHWEMALNSTSLSKKESSLVEQNLERLKKYTDTISKTKKNEDVIPNVLPASSDKDPLIALLKIARTVSAQTDIDVLLKTIAEITKNAMDADRCTVFLLDKEKNELWSKVALGIDTQELRFPADKGLAGHVLAGGETIIINDAYKDRRFNKEIDMQTGYKTKTILCMPIRNIKHEIVGVFQVLNKNGGEFTEHDEDLLIAIGSSAGIALENAQLFKRQHEMLEQQTVLFESFIDTLVASIDARDKSTSGHSNRVKMYSRLICDALGFDSQQINSIESAAILHDIGKIGIRDSVLQKEGKLTPDEYRHIQQHVKITYDILSKIYLSNTKLDGVAEIAATHHEKYDGTGYFRGLKKEEIPIGGRILAVADVFDAITSHRHYRAKMPIKDAIEVILSSKDAHLDGHLVDVFINISLDKIVVVFLSEFKFEPEEEDKILLSRYTLADLYDIIIKSESNTEKLTDSEEKLVSVFNKYYTYRSMLNE